MPTVSHIRVTNRRVYQKFFLHILNRSLLAAFFVSLICVNVGCGRLGYERLENDGGSRKTVVNDSANVASDASQDDSGTIQVSDARIPADSQSATDTGTSTEKPIPFDAEVITDSGDDIDMSSDDTSIVDASEDTGESDSAFADSSDAPFDAGAGCVESCTTTALNCHSGPCACATGSICPIDCSTNTCAQIRCETRSTCTVACGSSNCNAFDCQTRSKCEMDCNDALCNGVINCGENAECQIDCRNGNCHDAICADGSICDFDCTNTGDCKDVQCLAGASCTFDCRNGSCTEIQCAAGATCTFQCESATCDVLCDSDADCNCMSGSGIECDAICGGQESPCSN